MKPKYNTEKEMLIAKFGKDVEVFNELPDGWRYLEGTTTQPNGYKWACNKKSIFSIGRKLALIRQHGEKTFEMFHK